MPIVRTSPKGAASEFVRKILERQRRAIIENLTYIGEQALREARGHREGYKDQTGNLRSSIGYCIVEDGQIIHQSDFEVVKEGHEGKQKGQEYLQKIIEQSGKGISLIMVAGMPYAEYVEAMSLNVLDTSQQLAEKKVKEWLAKINKK